MFGRLMMISHKARQMNFKSNSKHIFLVLVCLNLTPEYMSLRWLC
jgi:hypothetical protein